MDVMKISSSNELVTGVAGQQDLSQRQNRSDKANSVVRAGYGNDATNSINSSNKNNNGTDATNPNGDAVKISEDDALKMQREMNAFMEKLNTGIRFTVHDETNRLMMQVVDQQNGEVLKEIPSQEMLDMMAKLSEYVGALLDKKA